LDVLDLDLGTADLVNIPDVQLSGMPILRYLNTLAAPPQVSVKSQIATLENVNSV